MTVAWYTLLIPNAEATEKELVRWRTIIALWLVAVTLGMGSSVWYFAKADDVSEAKENSARAVAMLLEQRMDRVMTALCMQPGERILLETIAELQREYRTLRQRNYDIPPCSLLMRVQQ
jgi:uncharacterized protein HemX